jgi:hypothetical protein
LNSSFSALHSTSAAFEQGVSVADRVGESFVGEIVEFGYGIGVGSLSHGLLHRLGLGLPWCSRTLAARLFCVITVYMKRQSVLSRKKKRRGPLPTGKGELLGVRIHPPQLAALDGWIGQQPDRPSRPEAIRRLIERALPGTNIEPAKRSRKKLKRNNDSDCTEGNRNVENIAEFSSFDPGPIESEPCVDCDTPQDFWQRSLGVMAGDAIAMRASWSRLYSDWEEFEVTSELVTLAKQAADEWSKLAKFLENRKRRG